MDITLKEAKSILTPQHTGALAAKPYPFTHALSGYVGCGFGQTTCGLYCYAQFLPNWSFSGFTAPWGQAIRVKTNAAELLDKALRSMRPTSRQKLRIFMNEGAEDDWMHVLELSVAPADRCTDCLDDHDFAHWSASSSNDSRGSMSSHQHLPGDSIFLIVDVLLDPC